MTGMDDGTVIERRWRGWTEPGDADEYERLLREEILPGFDADVDGLVGYTVVRRVPGEQPAGDEAGDVADHEVAFATAIRFDSMDAVRAFAGQDYRQAHVPEAAQALLSRWDEEARHYEVLVDETV